MEPKLLFWLDVLQASANCFFWYYAILLDPTCLRVFNLVSRKADWEGAGKSQLDQTLNWVGYGSQRREP